MATGRLAAVDITNANTDTQLYVVPSNKVASFSLCLTNRNSTSVQVRIALTPVSSVTTSDYIAYDVTIYPNDTYEKSGLVLTDSQYVFVRSSATGVNAVAYGYEE